MAGIIPYSMSTVCDDIWRVIRTSSAQTRHPPEECTWPHSVYLVDCPPGNICHNHGIPDMMYADNQPLYVAFKATSQVYYVKCIESIGMCY